MQNISRFAELNTTSKIWAIGSIHSHINSFETIKKHILNNFEKNDKIIFLGNIIGVGSFAKQTLTSVLDLRSKLMASFCLEPNDIVFLRGAQEEMFLKLLQIQTAPNPKEIIEWMFEHGVDKTIHSYGLDSNELFLTSTQGIIRLTKWSADLNKVLGKNFGHKEYFSNLCHAAFPKSKKILFVNRGVDVTRPLSAQSDCFWWGYHNFSKLEKPYRTFKKIIRGYDPSQLGKFNLNSNKTVFSLYTGPLSNTKILGGIFSDSGDILDLFESK